jgi:hypothetical protein
MKAIFYLFWILLVFSVSCEDEDNVQIDKSNLEYFADKTIWQIEFEGDTKYIFSWGCDTCFYGPGETEPGVWTVIQSNSSLVHYDEFEFEGVPKSASRGNLYRGEYKSLYKLVDGEYKLFLDFKDFSFYDFIFDNQGNIWFYKSNEGIGYWNNIDLTVYNSENSLLSHDYIYHLCIDQSNVVWVDNAYEGILKIEAGNWINIPGSQIPGFSMETPLQGPWIDHDDNLFFEIIRSDTNSNVLRFHNTEWTLEYPDTKIPTMRILTDSRARVWAINYAFEKSSLIQSLKYFENYKWIDVDVTDIAPKILVVNADDHIVYIGTERGLFEKDI